MEGRRESKEDRIVTVQDMIERMMRRDGVSLHYIEEKVIDPITDLDDDEKAALWLFAWCQLSRRRQLREVTAHLEALSG